ncbi:alkanesulfonate monooxygenase SsuD/methylene tetrahydromethanopterin reductase-like flavin-dependent oxidoreductase (luciferase family) [Nocardiopsis arvandica]|uniref:Alkanesulfonate monooxygenase SsuD/methylene tetrahydromethanopterin reductase-like flavin-dependent oxidoreductase (Luciferase family) n=1 Tax=Nocardiopsis sinuspersici TaxID=501010 RepID=A0A7Z0BLJ4_9ACTN|nr:LLM class flavin-dependent oxidoreductase [Nocardiopsis sinuspersici]NYH55306.1 alkanesulfonate monooxygenase SsuD/methylene tetrahydromethanopterin reductase-like flavin-dependent oxidoreductase (luciferase family) [Nocardiopsis sinuspersici]
MTTLGAVFRPQLPPERLRSVARAADDAGLDQLWLWEDCFLESGIAAAAAALAWTHHLTVGVGLLPVPLRNVALTAMETATLHRLFPGRVHLGVGHGVQDWMAQAGAHTASPLTLLREHLDALRALLAGERVTVQGRYVTLDDVRLDYPPTTPAPVLAGARGPRTLHLTGQAADGTLLDAGMGVEGVARARRLADQGREDAGRTGHHPVTAYLLAATGADAAARMDAELHSENLPPGTGVAGDAQTIAHAVRRMADAGADTVVLQPTADEPDPEGFVRFTARQVRPLLR